MSAEKPKCKEVTTWLKNVLGRDALAPLTGQDFRALQAFAHLVDLWCCSDGMGRLAAIVGMRAAVIAMQPKLRFLAKASIPCVGDWSHGDQIWDQICDDASVGLADDEATLPDSFEVNAKLYARSDRAWGRHVLEARGAS